MDQTKNQCKHFVMRKKRFCRMTVKSGCDYCGEHQPKVEQPDETSDLRVRIPCPLDNKHTCFASKLAKHLKICNAKKDSNLPYIVPNINAGSDEVKPIETGSRQLSNVPTSKILEVIQKVNKLHKDFIEKSISEKILRHDALSDEIKKPEYGATTRKHLIQTSSLIKHIEQANLMQPDTCFVEFGAGKGQLSFWLSKVTNSIPGTSVLLVERASLRHKMDNKLDKSENNVHRIRADIADLVLSKVEVVMQSKNVVGATKHLCGEATDLAVRCLQNSMNQGTKIAGLVMAFCCHHRCQWPTYTGKHFFESNDLRKEDFDVICGLVSWATCGTGQSRERNQNKEAPSTEVEKETNENNQAKARDAEIGLTRDERELVGKKCKLLIDYGRVSYLEGKKFSCQLYYYVNKETTLENVCLVACKS